MILSRDAIEQARDFQTETVTVAEWGGDVRLRSMTVGAMDDIQIRYLQLAGAESASAENGTAASVLYRNPELLREMKTRLLSYCLCDAEGTLLFNDEQGRAILSQKNPAVIDRLYEIASRLNRLGNDDIEQEKKV